MGTQKFSAHIYNNAAGDSSHRCYFFRDMHKAANRSLCNTLICVKRRQFV